MDSSNQNTTANTNPSSATPMPGAPTDANVPAIDMDAINDAIAAEGAKDPNLQNTFNVDDISLDGVPQSQSELDQRMQENPDMSLAGGSDANISAGMNAPLQDDSMGMGANSTPVQGATMGASVSAGINEEKKSAPAAAFVDGDIVDEAEEETPAAPAPSYDNINTDPLSDFETNTADTAAAQSLGEPIDPTSVAAPTSDISATGAVAEPPIATDSFGMGATTELSMETDTTTPTDAAAPATALESPAMTTEPAAAEPAAAEPTVAELAATPSIDLSAPAAGADLSATAATPAPAAAETPAQDNTPAAAETPAQDNTPASTPSAVAASSAKSKKPIIIGGVCAIVALAIVIVAVVLLNSK